MFENVVLKKIFGLKREEVRRGWRKQHKEALHDLYSPRNTTQVTNQANDTRRRVARKEEKKNVYPFYLEYLDIDGKVILKRILKKYNGTVHTGLISLTRGTCGRLL